MPYNKIHNLYHLYHDQVQLKKNACDQKINQLKSEIAEYKERQSTLSLSISSQWQKVAGQSLSREAIFVMKRKESLLMARYNRIELILEELTEAIKSVEDQRQQLNYQKISYAKKKEKWALLNKRVRKIRKSKNINREEQQANENIICKVELFSQRSKAQP
ncbi:MAG: hypothetical protein QRY16_14515 [Enterobacterales bacterium endosymbiont of Blomia tropicalis]|uniref:hypothetical protein n=1 Tax=Mixta mediterraneensis TaxID=2758443 RepID=UPI001873E2B1|nr:hypothetical protein [Mixta mediterraneensis]MBE5251916.1 hypothetical protein [Mixta mediterraneensis]MDL4914953.1 hypothetical protein [Mixta mediterraneensis]